MPTLPAASAFTGSTVTEAQFKTAITDEREFLAGLLGTAGTQSAALTTLGALLNGVLSKSADYTIVAADRGRLVDYTAAPYTVTLPTVANAGAGFVVGIKNSAASGTLTVGRNSANIDGAAANITLGAGESCLIVCDGTGWKTVGKTASVAADVQTFPTAGSATWIKPSVGTWARIELWGGGASGAKNYTVGGAGGAYAVAILPLASLPETVSVTVGAGGAARTTNGRPNAGGNSSFGAYVTAGGGGGVDLPTENLNLGGGNNFTGATGSGWDGGHTSSYDDDFRVSTPSYGLEVGAVGNSSTGWNALYAGASGGAARGSTGTNAGGTSTFGGNGGTGTYNTSATDGAQPGGGGGSTNSGTSSGKGGDGKAVITVF